MTTRWTGCRISRFNPMPALTRLEVCKHLRGMESVLDIGCGAGSPISGLRSYKVGVDGFSRSIDAARQRRTHDEFRCMDVREVRHEFSAKCFDAVVALDLIEHLSKPDGLKLIADMEEIARKLVVVLTPNGFVPQHDEENDLQEHLSGWTPSEFRELGYQAYGAIGLKVLREGVKLRYRPKVLFSLISVASQLLVCRSRPEWAFALIALKRLQ